MLDNFLVTMERILDADFFKANDYIAIFEARGKPPFEHQLATAEEEIEVDKEINHFNDEDEALVNAIAQKAFNLTSHHTQNDEIAGYISDDFRLIATTIRLEIEDEWVCSLLNSYIKKKIPCADMEIIDSDFEKLLASL
jgi:hypothetical protein